MNNTTVTKVVTLPPYPHDSERGYPEGIGPDGCGAIIEGNTMYCYRRPGDLPSRHYVQATRAGRTFVQGATRVLKQQTSSAATGACTAAVSARE